ncbi:MAG: adenosylcobinamide kinase / adenosylcobinamide-phosphate guanylyltransferase [Chloroflexota bacterium]|nr:adenosylcobinamide kinase / adenosylcobinamide-phosphate guanylyltransferase [Chloroflexota bacterium]
MGRSLTLILGGARSGKSHHAQEILRTAGGPVLFVATATAGDEEMAARIRAHQVSRPPHWTTLEAPLNVGAAIRAAGFEGDALLDCLTLLASNVLMTCPQPLDEALYQEKMDGEVAELLAAYTAGTGDWVVVSNEVGLGLIPPTPLGRFYRDVLGRANQRMAAAADRVLLMVAGIPMQVK